MPGTTIKEVCMPRALAPQQEKVLQKETHALQQSSSILPQQEKAYEQQWRFSAVNK